MLLCGGAGAMEAEVARPEVSQSPTTQTHTLCLTPSVAPLPLPQPGVPSRGPDWPRSQPVRRTQSWEMSIGEDVHVAHRTTIPHTRGDGESKNGGKGKEGGKVGSMEAGMQDGPEALAPGGGGRVHASCWLGRLLPSLSPSSIQTNSFSCLQDRGGDPVRRNTGGEGLCHPWQARTPHLAVGPAMGAVWSGCCLRWHCRVHDRAVRRAG